MPERSRGRDPNRRTNEQKETLLPSFTRAVKYPDERSSEQPYDEANILIRDNPYSLSIFRLLRGEELAWHIAVLGEQPGEEFIRRLDTILSSGEATALPEDEIAVLFLRRLAQTQGETKEWVEKSYRPRRRRI